MLNRGNLDGRPTMSEWPVRIWSLEEVPRQYETKVRDWLTGDFSEYDFVYAPNLLIICLGIEMIKLFT